MCNSAHGIEEMSLALIRSQRRSWMSSLSRRAGVGKSSTFGWGRCAGGKAQATIGEISKKMGYRALFDVAFSVLLLPGWFFCVLDMSLLHRLTTLFSGLWGCRVMTQPSNALCQLSF